MQLPLDKVHALAAEVNRHAQLAGVRVHRLNCEAFEPLVEGTLEVQVELEFQSRQADDVLEVNAEYLAKATPLETDSEADSLAWEVTAELISSYRLDDEAPTFTQEQLHAFNLLTASLAIHPFARELIHNMTGRLGYPPFMMDLLRKPLPTGNPDQLVDLDLEDQTFS